MAQPVQTVIYRLDPAHDPAWQFYAMPESIVGGGKTLDEARAEYRDALTFSLDTNVLPAIREYVEREIGNLGIWMRIPVGLGDFDVILSEAERQIEPDDRDWFFANPTAGGDPVILNTLPDVPLSSILDQMSVYDTLILAMRFHGPEKVQNLFVAFAGAATESVSDKPLTSLESLGLTADSPLSDLLEAAVKLHVTTVSAPAFC
jgi:hypothetical protein